MAKATANNAKLFVLNVVAWIPIGVAGMSYLALYERYPHLASDLNTVVIAACIAAVLISVRTKTTRARSVARIAVE